MVQRSRVKTSEQRMFRHYLEHLNRTRMVHRYSIPAFVIFFHALAGTAQEQPACYSVGSVGRESFTDVLALPDGGSYAVGTVSPGGANEQVLVTRLNSAAEIVWSRSIGGAGKDRAISGQLTGDGGLVVCGYSDSHTTAFNFDMLVARLTPQGEVSWVTVVENPGSDAAYGIAAVPGGGWMVTGEVQAINGGHLALLKIAEDGSVVFSKRINSASLTRGADIIALNDGGYAIVGTHSSPNGGLLLMRLDADGEPVWRRAYSPLETQGLGIVEGEDGALAACGMISNSGTPTDLTDGVILSVDVDGEPLWGFRVAGPFSDQLNDIVGREGGGYLAAGRGSAGAELADYNALLVGITGDGVVVDTVIIGQHDDGAGIVALAKAGAGFLASGYRTESGSDVGDTDGWLVRLHVDARPCPVCGANGVGSMTFPPVNGNTAWTEGFITIGTATTGAFTSADHGSIAGWCLSTGIADADATKAPLLFPDPVVDRFSVDASGVAGSGPFEWSLRGSDGRLVLSGRSASSIVQVDAGTLPSGIFLFELRGSRTSAPIRFVKQ